MDYQEFFLTKGTHKTVYMIVNELRYNLWHMDKDCYARMQYLKTELQNDEIEDIFSILFSHQCRIRNKMVPIISGMDDMTFSFKVKSGIRIYTNVIRSVIWLLNVAYGIVMTGKEIEDTDEGKREYMI